MIRRPGRQRWAPWKRQYGERYFHCQTNIRTRKYLCGKPVSLDIVEEDRYLLSGWLCPKCRVAIAEGATKK